MDQTTSNVSQQSEEPHTGLDFERFWTIVNEFAEDLQQALPNYSQQLQEFMLQYDDISTENENKIIKTVLKPIKNYSKFIISHNDVMFTENQIEWMGFNFSEMWQGDSLSDYAKFFVWQYIEEIYVVGTLILNPEKKDLILKTLRHIKSKYPPPPPPLPDMNEMGQAGMSVDDQQINNATEHLKQVFAGNDQIQDFIGEISEGVGKTLQQPGGLQKLMTGLMTGDKDAFGDILNFDVDKYQDAFEDVDESEIMAKASQLFQGASQNGDVPAGFNPMQMMSMFSGMMPPQMSQPAQQRRPAQQQMPQMPQMPQLTPQQLQQMQMQLSPQQMQQMQQMQAQMQQQLQQMQMQNMQLQQLENREHEDAQQLHSDAQQIHEDIEQFHEDVEKLRNHPRKSNKKK